jgi:hypothetical protein
MDGFDQPWTTAIQLLKIHGSGMVSGSIPFLTASDTPTEIIERIVGPYLCAKRVVV